MHLLRALAIFVVARVGGLAFALVAVVLVALLLRERRPDFVGHRAQAGALARGGDVDFRTVVENSLGANDGASGDAHQGGGFVQGNHRRCFSTFYLSTFALEPVRAMSKVRHLRRDQRALVRRQVAAVDVLGRDELGRVGSGEGFEARLNASGLASAVAVAAVEDRAVQKNNGVELSVLADRGDKLVKLLALDQREQIGQRMRRHVDGRQHNRIVRKNPSANRHVVLANQMRGSL